MLIFVHAQVMRWATPVSHAEPLSFERSIITYLGVPCVKLPAHASLPCLPRFVTIGNEVGAPLSHSESLPLERSSSGSRSGSDISNSNNNNVSERSGEGSERESHLMPSTMNRILCSPCSALPFFVKVMPFYVVARQGVNVM